MSALLRLLSIVAGAGAMIAVAGATPDQVGPEPYVSVTLRNGGAAGFEPGLPLRVAVRIEGPKGDDPTVELAPVTGTWVDCVHVELVASGSTAPLARATAVGRPESPRATLGTGRAAAGLWRFSPADTQKLAPGEYSLRVRLAIDAGAGWKGAVEAETVPVIVAAPSDAPERSSLRALALAHDDFIEERFESAAGRLDALLRAQPDNVRAWMLRGAACERAGNTTGALACLGGAKRLYAGFGLREPYAELEAMHGRVLAAMYGTSSAAGGVNPAALPAWSFPPFELLALADQRSQEMVPKRAAPVSAATTPATPVTPAAPAAAVVTPPSRAGGPSPAVATPLVSLPVGNASPPPGMVVPLEQVKEADVLKDTAGQWAESAKASSEYGPSDYSARQATGAPDVPAHADDKRAWSASASERNPEWLELTYARAVRATGVRVRQSLNPGTIVRIEAFAPDGQAHVLWAGKDPNVYPKDRIAWLVVRFPKTEFLVQRVKVTLDMPAAKGWKQIDAVQLVGD